MAIDVIRRRDLPHWDVPNAAYFVTTCLEGSISARGLLEIQRYRNELNSRVRPPDVSIERWTRDNWKRSFAEIDCWLDSRPANRDFDDPRLAKIAADALYYFAGKRYDLLAFVVMPSHFHWVFQPLEQWTEEISGYQKDRTPRERIVHSINSHIGLECNRLLGRQGAFLQHESYDHWVRDLDELERIIHYVEDNPVKAGFVRLAQDWLFSSARDRAATGVSIGLPIFRI